MALKVITEIKDNVAYQILHHPEKKNALTLSLLEDLSFNLMQFSTREDIRCLVIRGAGSEIFSSGYDISAIPVATKCEPDQKPPEALVKTLDAVKTFPYPTIAMLNGHAFGAGFNLSACCDIRIAAETVKLRMPPAKLGVAYHPEGIQQFIEAFGIDRTKEIFYTADIFQGQDLLKKGFVHQMVKQSDLERFTHAYAVKISQHAPLSLKSIKKIIGLFENEMNLNQRNLESAEKLMKMCFASDDLKEGQRAFKEKRIPKFTGK